MHPGKRLVSVLLWLIVCCAGLRQARADVLAFTHGAYQVPATTGSLTVTVARQGSGAGRLRVQYATADGTDLAGRDYAATVGVLRWKDGDTTPKTFQVPILDSHNPYQGDGTFLVNLSGAGVGAQNQAVVTVLNDNSAVTYVHFTCDADSWVGAGQERTFAVSTGYRISVTSDTRNGVHFAFDDRAVTGHPQFWDATIDPATGASLAAGDYPVAGEDFSTSGTHPVFSLSGDGRSDDTTAAHLHVLEAQFDAAGNLLRFAADFEEYAEGYMGGTAAIYGEIRYNSAAPRPVRVPRVTVIATTVYASSGTSPGATVTPGVFTFTRAGDTSQPLKFSYTVNGTAVSGQDYVPLKGSKKFKAGQNTVQLKVTALGAEAGDDLPLLELHLQPGADYVLGDVVNAEIGLANN